MDYGLMGGIGEGLQAGMETYMKTRQLQEARRQNDLGEALKAKVAGLQMNKEGTGWEAASDQGAYSTALRNSVVDSYKQSHKGATDEQIAGLIPSNLTANQYEKLGAQYKPELSLAGSLARADSFKDLIDQRREQNDQTVHGRIVNSVKTNPIVKQRLIQYQNLDNALATVSQAKTLTPEQISEFQQAVRSNLGIKGAGGVDERSHTMINTLGLNEGRWQEFLTGDPVELSKDSKLVQHLQDLAGVEQQNIKKQMNNSVDTASKGASSFYRRRPDLRGDLDELVQTQKSQFQSGLLPNDQAGGQPGLLPGGAMADPAAARAEKIKKLKDLGY